MRTDTLRLAPIVVLALLAACSREKAPAPEPAATPPPQGAATALAWPEFATQFVESRFAADPSFGVQAGRHEYDGRMPDLSRAALEVDAANLRNQLAALDKFESATLKPAERYEREYLRWV